MKKLLFIFPFILSAYTVNTIQDSEQAPIEEVEVIRSNSSTQTYNRPYQPPSTTYYYDRPGSYRENTSQDAWHNQPNNESYYDDPNWPNIKR